jgi:hypothetical protein
MTDFDTRLRERFQHLDAAIPDPRLPIAAAPGPGLKRRRQAMFLLAAAALFLGTAAAAAFATMASPDPGVMARNAGDEERVRDDLGKYTADACLSRDQATTLFRQRLDALGLKGWTIRADDRIKEARCVTGAPVGDATEVLLIASMGGDVSKALDAVSARLLADCLGRADAVSLIRSTLAGLGVQGADVEVTGIRQVPVGPTGDTYIAHIKAGCYVYGGAQFDEVGRYTWYVSGP